MAFAALTGCETAPTDPQQALAKVGPLLKAGTAETDAVQLLRRNGFRCREQLQQPWSYSNPAVVRTLFCPARTESTPGAFRVVYLYLGIDAQRRIAEIGSGAYGSGSAPATRL